MHALYMSTVPPTKNKTRDFLLKTRGLQENLSRFEEWFDLMRFSLRRIGLRHKNYKNKKQNLIKIGHIQNRII